MPSIQHLYQFIPTSLKIASGDVIPSCTSSRYASFATSCWTGLPNNRHARNHLKYSSSLPDARSMPSSFAYIFFCFCGMSNPPDLHFHTAHHPVRLHGPSCCHSERSEESHVPCRYDMAREILRCAQNDSIGNSVKCDRVVCQSP